MGIDEQLSHEASLVVQRVLDYGHPVRFLCVCYRDFELFLEEKLQAGLIKTGQAEAARQALESARAGLKSKLYASIDVYAIQGCMPRGVGESIKHFFGDMFPQLGLQRNNSEFHLANCLPENRFAKEVIDRTYYRATREFLRAAANLEGNRIAGLNIKVDGADFAYLFYQSLADALLIKYQPPKCNPVKVNSQRS